MKQIVGNYGISSYTFTASTRQVVINNRPKTLTLESLLAIVNVTSQVVIYQPNNTGKGATLSGSTYTLEYDTTSMNNTDSLMIIIDTDYPGYDATTDTEKNTVQNPESSYYQAINGEDTTNVTAATNYYPSSLGLSMDQYKHFSISGKMIDADGTMTLSVEATNDEDQTNADWIQVYGYDDLNNTTTNSRAVTNGTLTYAISFNNMNYQFVRVKMVNNGNTNTFILKLRQVY